jgi:hypothetical protein
MPQSILTFLFNVIQFMCIDALCHSVLHKAFQNGLEATFSTKGHRDLICGMSFSRENLLQQSQVGWSPTFTFCTAAYDDRVRVWKYDDSRARNGVACCESVYTFRELQSITAVTMDTLHQDVFAACSYKNKVWFFSFRTSTTSHTINQMGMVTH